MGEIEEWRAGVVGLQQSGATSHDLGIAHEVVASVFRELLSFPRLHEMIPEDTRMQDLAVGARSWFLSVVASPYQYILGDKVALAVDVVLFLKALQETGEVKDDAGRVVASLLDTDGQPYPYLVHEYALHEALERTRLNHDQIIELTTQVFGYGLYRLAGAALSASIQSGTWIFTRPSQTPLGRALRMFIAYRFGELTPLWLGQWVHMSVFDPAFQSVLFLQGVLKHSDGSGRASGATVTVVGHHNEIMVGWDRILRMTRGFGPVAGTFSDASLITPELVGQHLRAGQQVTLTEPQARTVANLNNPASWLNQLLAAVCGIRDSEGRRVRSRMRSDTAWAELMIAWAHGFSAHLAELGLSILVDYKLVLNDPVYPPFSFGLSSTGPPLTTREEHIMDEAERIRNALLGYRHLTLHPVRSDQGEGP